MIARTGRTWCDRGNVVRGNTFRRFLTTEKLLPYVDKCGVKRVVVSAPVKEPSVLNVVVGVNEHKLTDEHVICTAASCT